MIIDTALSPAEIDLLPQADLSSTTCVVFDILRATTSILTALAHGAQAIRPVATIEEARHAKTEWPDAILGGERFGARIDGFDLGNSPREYARPDLRRIITTTTNGTVALRACMGTKEAQAVLVGGLVNMAALTRRIAQLQPERLLLICAGTFRELALEDVLAAGMLASAFPDATFTDATEVAIATYRRHAGDLLAGLLSSTNGRKLVADGRGEDVPFCGQIACFDVVGVMQDGVIRPE
jgi:2-phosphosulfolactate phosphatase